MHVASFETTKTSTMKNITLLLIILFIGSFAHSKKFYTLNAGNWNNTAIWSLNNSTPCGCFPGYNVTTDTITVNHAMNLTGTVNASSSGRINVNSSGSVSSTTADIFVNNAVILANGAVNIRNLNVGMGGLFRITSSVMIINLNMDIYGSLIVDHSTITILNGNLNNYSGSNIQILNGSKYHSLTGNIKNEGTFSVCPTCCVQLDKGNITNQNTAQFKGSGGINLLSGNIKNLGSWGSTLMYCSSGNDTGLSTAENCIQAKQICVLANGGLPSSLLFFEGHSMVNKNLIQWETASEQEGEYYLLERSSDGDIWEELSIINTNGSQNVKQDYKYSDSLFQSSISYYRLSKLNSDGEADFKEMLSIKNIADNQIIIYPNPTSSGIWIQPRIAKLLKRIKVIEQSGKEIESIETNGSSLIEIILPSEKGIYYLQTEGDEYVNVYSVVKY